MEFLFDIPWYVPTSFAAAGVGLFSWANARLKKRERAAGVGLILLAVLLAGISYAVDTDQEKVEKRTREFVRAVVAADRAAIASLLDEGAIAFAWDKQEIIDGAVYYAAQTDLIGARILSLHGAYEGRTLVTYLTIWSQHGGRSSFPANDMNSQWKLEWVNRAGDWRIVEIIPQQIGQVSREAIERTYLNRSTPPAFR